MSAASACRSCGAAIVWARTVAGKLMPVDAEPADDGTLALIEDVDGELRVLVLGFDPDELRHRPHFSTCPEADEWRRR